MEFIGELQVAAPETEAAEARSTSVTLLALDDDLLVKIMHELAVSIDCRPFPGCMGSLSARATCRSLYQAADAEARLTLWREYRSFVRSHEISTGLAARAALVNAIQANEQARHLNASFAEKLWYRTDDSGRRHESVLLPHRAAVRVLASDAHQGGSGSDHEDSSSGSSVSLLIPLAEASQHFMHPQLMLGVHRFNQHAYSARYQEHATDDALLVWLELAEITEDGLRALKDAALALSLEAPAGLGASPMDRTKPKVVFAGQTTFYCEVDSGLDAEFFERLTRLLRLPESVPEVASFHYWECAPPSRAWPGMLWLSMVAAENGTALWEWFCEHAEISERPIDVRSFLDETALLEDPHKASYLPPPAVRPWISSAAVVGALESLGTRGARPMRNDLVLVDACARLRELTPELVGLASAHGCAGRLSSALLDRPERWLIHVDADSHSSRHDYCSTSAMHARLALPICKDPDLRIEVEVKLDAGSGYEHDDRHTAIMIRLPTRAAQEAFGGTHRMGEWLLAFERDPGSCGPGREQHNTAFIPTPLMDCLAASLGPVQADGTNAAQPGAMRRPAEVATMLLVGLTVAATHDQGRWDLWGVIEGYTFGEDEE